MQESKKKPGWYPTHEYNTCTDEYLNSPGVKGIFGPSGYCWVGFSIRRHNPAGLHGEFGIIIFNEFWGFWFDQNPDS